MITDVDRKDGVGWFAGQIIGNQIVECNKCRMMVRKDRTHSDKDCKSNIKLQTGTSKDVAMAMRSIITDHDNNRDVPGYEGCNRMLFDKYTRKSLMALDTVTRNRRVIVSPVYCQNERFNANSVNLAPPPGRLMPGGTPDLQELTIRIIKESLQDIPIHSGSFANAPYHDFPDSLKVYFGESWQVRRYKLEKKGMMWAFKHPYGKSHRNRAITGMKGLINSVPRLLRVRQSEDYIHS
eukprot:scaffold156739_cov23-Cyclotella_meneghiniana.AAC.1